MLIYNHKKEFTGISQDYLDKFNISNLQELQNLTSDFASFFVAKPGYIYDFKHVHWLDYILYDENGIAPKVLIEINDISYRANIDINVIYLLDNPSQRAYHVKLLNLKSTTDDLRKKEEEFFDPLKINYDEKIIVDIQPQSGNIIKDDAIKMDNVYNDDKEELKIKNSNYVFDPTIASAELGLPIDLVEEFVDDFIDQANSFKTDMYDSLKSNDDHKVKTLSHKLKGVAANLRIQDALEVLTEINQSQDLQRIKKDLDVFYTIIEKLSSIKES